MKRFLNIKLLILILITTAINSQTAQCQHQKRFFSTTSFWNQPIPNNPEIDSNSSSWIKMLKQEPTGENFGISFNKWTVPVYEVDSTTHLYEIKKHYLTEKEKINWNTKRECFGHGPGFINVPIPEEAVADPEEDAHIALIDRTRNIAWDMWSFHKLPDGTYESKTGMTYPLDGLGVYKTEDYKIIEGESVHFHGPSRASGVPIIAGLIMYDEVMSGEICHKLSCATRYGAFQQFVFPATWTDGRVPGGIPEGALIQLDPKLNLAQFNLTKEETIVAKALQKYGMIVVDMAYGQPIYAEGLWGHPDKSWKGKLREWDGGINDIPYQYYRVLKVTDSVHRGDDHSKNYKVVE
jgi:hypothetical protein